MTKEKLLKKRKRDIWLVVLFAILIAVFIAATIVTFSFQDEERVWITLLGVFFFILVICSIAITAFFGMHLNQENEKLHLIQKGVPEEDVEKKYQEIQEAKRNGTYSEEEQDESDTKQKVTTLGDLKKNKKIFYILTTIFGILTGLALIFYLANIPYDEEEEISNIVSGIEEGSFILFLVFLISLCVFGNELSKKQKTIDRLEKYGNDDEDISVLENRKREKELEETNERTIKYAKEKGYSYFYDKQGYVQINFPPLTTKVNKSSSKHYSVLDDHEWEHEVFHDDDLRDDDIMDFMDDDY